MIVVVVTVVKGEMVIVVEGSKSEVDHSNLSITDHINSYISNGMRTNDAIKSVAKERGLKKQDVYNEFHNIK